MADKTELHPVVQLLLARMDSHPEEFADEFAGYELRPSGPRERWAKPLRIIREHGTEADKQAIDDGLYAIRMGQAHELAMDELLNGDERRAEAVRQEARVLAQSAQTSLALAQRQQAQLYNNQYNNQHSNHLGLGTQSPLTALGVTTGGQPPLTGSMLNTLKRKVGL